MRVVQLVPSLDVGGAERMAALLALQLRTLGHDAALVSCYDPTGSWIEQELRAAGVPLRFLGKSKGFDRGLVPRLATALRELRPDVLHTHLHLLPYALPARALGHRRARVVHTLHNLAEHEVEPPIRLFQHVAFRAGVTPVCIGDAVARSFERTYRRPAGAVIPNGIPVARHAPPSGARAAVRAELGIDDARPLFLTAGRLNAQKNQALLVRAFADPALAHATLCIAGEGELRDALERQAAEAGRDIRFLGVRRDLPRWMGAADAFVLPSDWEGNPLVVMEAMAAGLAVIATAVGCVPELVTEETGFLVPKGDARALAGVLARGAAAPGTLHARGAAGARVARERLDVSVMATSYVAVYASVMGGR